MKKYCLSIWNDIYDMRRLEDRFPISFFIIKFHSITFTWRLWRTSYLTDRPSSPEESWITRENEVGKRGNRVYVGHQLDSFGRVTWAHHAFNGTQCIWPKLLKEREREAGSLLNADVNRKDNNLINKTNQDIQFKITLIQHSEKNN